MRSNEIRKMSGKDYEKALSTDPIVLIPTGACEIYGPHLPMGSDLLVAAAIAERVASRTNSLIAPTLEIGESSALASFSCTFALPRKILEDWLDFLLGKLIGDGVRKFLFLTGHAGNVETVNYVAKRWLLKSSLKVAQVDWWRFAAQNSQGILECEGQMAHGHASECGTSVLSFLYPELVDFESVTKVEPLKASDFHDILQLMPFSEKTHNGTIGDATIGDAKKGRLIVERCVRRIVDFMNSFFGE